MDEKRRWLSNFKQKCQGYLSNGFGASRESCSISHEKLPPRLQFKGMSIAARVVGHEIRSFTKRTTGKDLAGLRHSKTRQQMLSKLSELRIAISNKDTKYNLLTLACCHSTNFTSSLSPVGEVCTLQDNDFENNNSLHEFIAKYHERCVQKTSDNKQIVRKSPSRAVKRKITPPSKAHELKTSLCKCYADPSLDEKRSCHSFLSCWEHKGIEEDKLDNYIMENVQHFMDASKKYELNVKDERSEWREFLRNSQCVVFRKKLDNGLFEYRVQATFLDISANHLFTTQLDVDFRKKWDGYVIDLQVVDEHQSTSSDLVHWVTKCPYPFSTREYIYLRRSKIDLTRRAMVLYQEATSNTDIPFQSDVERVDTYVSKIIVKPHNEDFDRMGCDFLLTYYDDPKMRLPQYVLDMAAKKGIEGSVDRMHKAALRLKDEKGNIE